MKVKDLIKALKEYPPNMEIYTLFDNDVEPYPIRLYPAIIRISDKTNCLVNKSVEECREEFGEEYFDEEIPLNISKTKVIENIYGTNSDIRKAVGSDRDYKARKSEVKKIGLILSAKRPEYDGKGQFLYDQVIESVKGTNNES